MSDGFAIEDSNELDPEYSDRADAYNVHLANKLECSNLTPRIWILPPGEEMSYHKHVDQEEFYFVLEGPGRIRLNDEDHDIPEGGAVRVSPEVSRQLRNDSDDEEHKWLVVAAPPRTHDGIHL